MAQEISQGEPAFEIADTGEYISIRFKGLIHFASQVRLIDTISEICASTGKNRFVVDARGCRLDYPLIERYRIAGYFVEKLGAKVTVACIIEQEHNSGLVENAAQNRGSTGIRITSSEADALEWIRRQPAN